MEDDASENHGEDLPLEHLASAPSAEGKAGSKLAKPAAGVAPVSAMASGSASSLKKEAQGKLRSGFARPTISSSAASLPRRNSTGVVLEKKALASPKLREPDVPVSEKKKTSLSNSDTGKGGVAAERRRASLPSDSSTESPSEANTPSPTTRRPSLKPALPVFATKKASPPQSEGSNGHPASGRSAGASGLSRSSTSSTKSTSSSSVQRKSSTAESRDAARFMMLPQVDVKAGDELRLDLRGHRVRILTSLNLSPNLEFVYLRDNLLSSLEGIEMLKRVKVLDLSFNDFKGPDLRPLKTCEALQQLYLAGNQITTLARLPQFPNLEFLSVAQNKLKSLSMPNQPQLQVLAASKNKISTLKGFPHLPALEHLRLEENPLRELSHLEAASILLVGPSLKKFNDRDLSPEELEIAKLYPPHAAFCIRNGWEFCNPKLAEDSTFRFLVDQWKDHLPTDYVVKEALVDKPYEEDACRCHFSFVSPTGNFELTLKFQWFIGDRLPTNFVAIPDAVGEVYWPRHGDIGKCLKVQCTPFLGAREYPSIFAFSFPVSPGTRCPKVVNLSVEGELVEGNVIKGVIEVAWCGATPGKCVASWLRRTWNGSPVAIIGAEDEEYRLTVDDIDSSLVFMYTPVTGEGAAGEAHYAITDFVKAAAPSVINVRIEGDAVEGNTIKGVGEYFGGKEGPSKFQWLWESKENSDLVLASAGISEYTLTKEDVGRRMAFVYVPINFEGHEGKSVSVMTSIVKQAPPKAANLKIIGDLREGNLVTVTASVSGGTERSSRVQWFKTICSNLDDEKGIEAISTSKIAKTYRIHHGAVGHYIVAKFTPMALDGETGEPAYVISQSVVEALPPSLNFASVTGNYCEDELLTASYGYIGGHEGRSIYNWYLHESETDPGLHIPDVSGHLQYRITKDSVGKYISFKCTPVREDGIVGEPITYFAQERVCPGNPKVVSLKILGKGVEGTTLIAEKKYWGGHEGHSIFRWFLTAADGTQTEVQGAIGASYTLTFDDIGCLVTVSCEPIRNDWARGPIVISDHVGPILPGLPTCHSLELIGLTTEGERLGFNATYSGGGSGNCTHEWSRVKNGVKENLSLKDFFDLTVEDVGGCIALVYTPIRKDGLKGSPKTIISDIIAPANPRGLELALPDCCEDSEVIPLKSYFGGKEGVSKFIWYRTKRKMEYVELQNMSNGPEDIIVVGKNLTYTPCLEDVGSYLSLYWVPTRSDGVVGVPLVASSNHPVMAAHPSVSNVCIKEASYGLYFGDGKYFGGHEGLSQYSWYRETSDGSMILINGANSTTYEVTDSDYGFRLVFGYEPIRSDSVSGELEFSDPSHIILPEIPVVENLYFDGKGIEGEILKAVVVVPKTEIQGHVWNRYKKEVSYQWFISVGEQGHQSFEPLPFQQSCSYRVRFEDIDQCLRCECSVTDVFGRSSQTVSASTDPIVPGVPKIDKLVIEGRGFHTDSYAIHGVYTGGKEGKSRIQWLRSTIGSPDLISIPGEIGRIYEANVDDVGYQLVIVYTPVREDGVEGKPVSVSTGLVAVEPDILHEVKQKLDLGSVKFEVLCEDRSVKKVSVPGIPNLERRILELNKKRVKVVKAGSKASFPSTEIRGSYAPPFHVELCRNDPRRFKIVVDSKNEIDLLVQTRRLRDVVVLVIRGLAQRFNSTSLNSLLQMET